MLFRGPTAELGLLNQLHFLAIKPLAVNRTRHRDSDSLSPFSTVETKWLKYDHSKHTESCDVKLKAFHYLLVSFLGVKHAPYGSTTLDSIDELDMMSENAITFDGLSHG